MSRIGMGELRMTELRMAGRGMARLGLTKLGTAGLSMGWNCYVWVRYAVFYIKFISSRILYNNLI